MRPIGSKIIVRPKKTDTISEGGIYIPEDAREKPQIGTVIAAGKGTYQNGVFCPNEIKEGDIVMYGKYSGTEVELNDEKVLIMGDFDVLVVLDE